MAKGENGREDAPSPPRSRSFRFPGATYAGERLDVALARHVGGISRARLQQWVRGGCVRIDGEVVTKPGRVLERGEDVAVDPPIAVALAEPSTAIELAVLYEDADLLAFDKPAGLVVHRNDRAGGGTLADFAQARFGRLPSVAGEDRPGVVHRLDRETSGVIVMARTAEALVELKRQFKEREVEKTYLAIVHDAPRFDSEWIEEEIGRDERHPERKAIVARGSGREAATFYEVRERYHGFALLACKPRTGRTHQIRVHLTHIGHPLVGDRLYRRRGPHAVALPADAPRIERQALHALELAVTHPRTGERLVLRAEPPPDFAALRRYLAEHCAP